MNNNAKVEEFLNTYNELVEVITKSQTKFVKILVDEVINKIPMTLLDIETRVAQLKDEESMFEALCKELNASDAIPQQNKQLINKHGLKIKRSFKQQLEAIHLDIESLAIFYGVIKVPKTRTIRPSLREQAIKIAEKQAESIGKSFDDYI